MPLTRAHTEATLEYPQFISLYQTILSVVGQPVVVNVWMVREGSGPPQGDPWKVMLLADCCEKLGLIPADFWCDPTDLPKFGEPAKLAEIRDPRFVFVELDVAEAAQSAWKPGFYKLKLSPKEANARCVA